MNEVQETALNILVKSPCSVISLAEVGIVECKKKMSKYPSHYRDQYFKSNNNQKMVDSQIHLDLMAI